MLDQELRELARRASDDRDLGAAQLLVEALRRAGAEGSVEEAARAALRASYEADVKAVAKWMASACGVEPRPIKHRSNAAGILWDMVTEKLREHPRVREVLHAHGFPEDPGNGSAALEVLAASENRGLWRAYYMPDEIGDPENIYPKGHVAFEVEGLAAVVMQEDVIAELKRMGVLEDVPEEHYGRAPGRLVERRPPCRRCGARIDMPSVCATCAAQGDGPSPAPSDDMLHFDIRPEPEPPEASQSPPDE